MIEPIFEKEFLPMSYGFRPGKGCKDALREVDGYLREGYTHVVDADLKGYFDSIPHDLLKARIEEHISDGRSALHSHYSFDIGVIPTRAQNDLDV